MLCYVMLCYVMLCYVMLCYGNKNGGRNRLKKRNCHYGPNLKLLETEVLRIRYQDVNLLIYCVS